MSDYLKHYGVLGMKWGVRRYQNKDGSLTPAGKKRYYNADGSPTFYIFTRKKHFLLWKTFFNRRNHYEKLSGNI